VGRMSQPLQKALVDYIEQRKKAELQSAPAKRPVAETDTKPPASAPKAPSLREALRRRLASRSASLSSSSSSTDDSPAGGLRKLEERPWLQRDDDSLSNASDSGSPELLALEDEVEDEPCEDGSEAESAGGAPESQGLRANRHGHRVGHRGLCQIHAKKGVIYYEARIMLRGLTLATRTTRDLEEGINFHTILGAVRQRVQELEDLRAARQPEEAERASAAKAGEPVCPFIACLRQALAEVEGVAGLGLTFQVVMDARQWIGRMVSAPRMTQEEGLSVWIQHESARTQGWSSLRKIWVDWMQKERRRCWSVRTRTPGEAEDHAAKMERAYLTTRENRERSRLSAQTRQERREQRRAEREALRASRSEAQRKALVDVALPRAIAFAEMSLQALQRHQAFKAKRTAVEEHERRKRQREEIRRRERFWKQRRTWNRRNDLTMEQIRSGYMPEG